MLGSAVSSAKEWQKGLTKPKDGKGDVPPVSILAAGVLSAAIIPRDGWALGWVNSLHSYLMNHFAQKWRCLRQMRLMITRALVWLLSSNLNDWVFPGTSF